MIKLYHIQLYIEYILTKLHTPVVIGTCCVDRKKKLKVPIGDGQTIQWPKEQGQYTKNGPLNKTQKTKD